MNSLAEIGKMPRAKSSLVKRFLLLFCFGFLMNVVIIGANYYIGLRLENNAIAINLSGNGRYRNYELYYLYDQLIKEKGIPQERDKIQKQIHIKVSELEHILSGLRNGDAELRLSQTRNLDINNQLDHVINKFNKRVKPVILRRESSEMNQEILRKEIPHIVGEVDRIVYLFETASVRQVEILKKVQVAFLVIIVLVAGIVAGLLIIWIKKPIYKVLGAMKELESGNLDYRFNEKRDDEIGMLIKGYDLMASQIKIKTRKLEKISQELRVLSITDGLTGLFNHRHFYDVLEKETIRAQRYDHPLSILFLDIDHFKNVNDRFGHKAGDEVLRQIALLLLQNKRQTDVAFRYGGEEFAVILPETNKQSSLIIAEKIRKAIEAHNMKKIDRLIDKITVSIGIAAYPGESGEYNGLVVAADMALYKAKSSGRNCCVLAE